jgi:hypothetical protein
MLLEQLSARLERRYRLPFLCWPLRRRPSLSLELRCAHWVLEIGAGLTQA